MSRVWGARVDLRLLAQLTAWKAPSRRGGTEGQIHVRIRTSGHNVRKDVQTLNSPLPRVSGARYLEFPRYIEPLCTFSCAAISGHLDICSSGANRTQCMSSPSVSMNGRIWTSG